MVSCVGINGSVVGRLAFPPVSKNVEGVSYTHQRPYRSSYACTICHDTTRYRFDGTVEVKEGGFEATVNSLKFLLNAIQNKSIVANDL